MADEPDLGLRRPVGGVPERVGIAVALALQGRERRGQHDRRVEGARPEGPDVGLARRLVGADRVAEAAPRRHPELLAQKTAEVAVREPVGQRVREVPFRLRRERPHEERDHAVAVGIRAVRHRVPVGGEGPIGPLEAGRRIHHEPPEMGHLVGEPLPVRGDQVVALGPDGTQGGEEERQRVDPVGIDVGRVAARVERRGDVAAVALPSRESPGQRGDEPLAVAAPEAFQGHRAEGQVAKPERVEPAW